MIHCNAILFDFFCKALYFVLYFCDSYLFFANPEDQIAILASCIWCYETETICLVVCLLKVCMVPRYSGQPRAEKHCSLCELPQLFVTMMSVISNRESKLFCVRFTALCMLLLVIKTGHCFLYIRSSNILDFFSFLETNYLKRLLC